MEHFCICNSVLVRLRHSLSNPSPPLSRLLEIYEEQGDSKNPRSRCDTSQAVIEQAGASNPGAVRLKIKENRKLPPSQVDKLVGAYVAGASILELGRRFGIHEQTVRAHLKRRGVNLRPMKVLSLTQEGETERLYVEMTWTLEEIALKYHVSETTILNVLKRRGVPRRGRERRATGHRPSSSPGRQGRGRSPGRNRTSQKGIPS